MSDVTTNEIASRRRPLGVWVVAALYLFSAGWMLLSLVLLASGAIPLTPVLKAYRAWLTPLDWVFTLTISVTGLSGAVAFFLLRKIAVSLFQLALVLNVTFTIFHLTRSNWIEATGPSGIVGLLLAWAIHIAVILYARRLAKRGVLA